MKKVHQEARIENVYQLEGRVPVGKAIPFGLQHVLAMFVANIAPLIIIASVAVYNGQAFTTIETAQLLQNCMLIAGIGTLIQLYPIWKIGSGLPVVMGLSFTFLAACMSAASQDYGIMVGSIIVGGIFEGILGLTAKYWRRIISPVLSSCLERRGDEIPLPAALRGADLDVSLAVAARASLDAQGVVTWSDAAITRSPSIEAPE